MKIGRILESKAGNFRLELGLTRDKEGKVVGKNTRNIFPIKLADGTVLNEGDVLYLRRPADEIVSLKEHGYITDEQAEQRINRIPTFVRYNVELPTPLTVAKG